MLRTPFAGQNRLSDAKTTFSVTTEQNKQKIEGKPLKIMQNMQYNLKNQILLRSRPAFGRRPAFMSNTKTLVDPP